MDLEQTIEAVHATIELATRQGLAQARIALSPEELGEIRIHLTQSAQGLIARVTADTPAAVQALAASHAELRQSLSALGLSALHLDTSASGALGWGAGAQTGERQTQRDTLPTDSRPTRRGDSRKNDGEELATEALDPTTASSTSQSADGTHIDVLV